MMSEEELISMRESVDGSVKEGLEKMQRMITSQFQLLKKDCLDPSHKFLEDYCNKYKEIEGNNATLQSKIAEMEVFNRLLQDKVDMQSNGIDYYQIRKTSSRPKSRQRQTGEDLCEAEAG